MNGHYRILSLSKVMQQPCFSDKSAGALPLSPCSRLSRADNSLKKFVLFANKILQ
jgi:hypothetical protein